MSVENTLKEREHRYGSFKENSRLCQTLKAAMINHNVTKWNGLSADIKQALELIQLKIARILGGDPTYADSWHDIGGFAKLVEDSLQAEQFLDSREEVKRKQETAAINKKLDKLRDSEEFDDDIPF